MIQWVEANMKSWEEECGGHKVSVSGLICGFLDGQLRLLRNGEEKQKKWNAG